MPQQNVEDHKIISRFLYRSKTHSSTEVKYHAFMPSNKENELGEFSVYETTSLGFDIIKKLSALVNKDPLKAQAVLEVGVVKQIQNKGSNKYLNVKTYKYPHPNHANIIGIKNSSKAMKQNLAQRLARASRLEVAR